MLKIGNELINLRINDEQTVNQVYFDESLNAATYLEISNDKTKQKNLEPDHHAEDVLNSIQASGGQYTHDNYPVTDDDFEVSEKESVFIPYSGLSWNGSQPVINNREDEVKPTELANHYSYNLLCKAEVHTEDGQKLGKVRDVYIAKTGEVEGLELSEGFLSDFLMSGQPYMKVNESVKLVDGNVIVPKDFHKELAK
ncbi:PRC-barrel domain-containing protein [Alkalihalobacillus sp. CinArs1]|uniref:PRC-barrel domain-containing protein n=1 Tax=Alkalihalobacillus sp. CinArs1 TaxID=2995314 RepID=UPI0022DE4034|nr:PRC-barrel domain-containing protein [Alkalihalobacillus sp. CinArs1]